MEVTLGHPRKDTRHWVNPFLRIDCARKGHHVETISAELSPEKDVDEADVGDDVDKEEKLTEDQPECPVVVCVEVFHKVVCKNLKLTDLIIKGCLTFSSGSLFVSCKIAERWWRH